MALFGVSQKLIKSKATLGPYQTFPYYLRILDFLRLPLLSDPDQFPGK